jgi:hypothetical protein
MLGLSHCPAWRMSRTILLWKNPNLFLICHQRLRRRASACLPLLAGALRGLARAVPGTIATAPPRIDIPTGHRQRLPPPRATPWQPLVADTAIAVAITTAVNAAAPGARVTRIEEIR